MNKIIISKKTKRVILLMISCILMFMFNIGIKNTEAIVNKNNVTKIVNEKTFKIDSNVVFRGAFSSHSWYFNIDKWWKTNYVEATVNFSINQLVDKGSKAYLVFSVNNIPFKSQKVEYNPKQEIQTIKAKIPTNLFKEGSNEFKVEAYLRETELPCVDDVNLANWLTIEDNSNVLVKFNELEADNMISNFPYPFLKNDDSKEADCEIVIPDNYTDEELESALMFNSYLGELYKDKNYNGKIVKYSDLDKNKNIIFLSNYKDMPNELKGLLKGNDEKSYKDNAIIKVSKSPFNNLVNTKILTITSDNNEKINKATKFMMNKSLVSQVNQSTFIVSNNVEELDKIKENKDEISFSDLGTKEILLKGPFRRTADLGLNIPKNRILANGGSIKLNFRYSENLDFDRSLVSIYINGTPIGSKKLTSENANGDSLEIKIPADIKYTDYLNIQVAFDLEMKNTWCEKRSEETPWALVRGDSYIYLPTSQDANYYFNKYPNPFIKDDNFNNVLVILPDKMESNDLTALGNMFAYMGKNIRYNNGNIKVRRGSNVGEEKKNNNIIIYGTPNNNPFIKEVNKNLWFKYNNDFKAFESNAKQYLTSPYNSEISTFQLDVSPYNNQMGMLVLTSPNKNILLDSMEYLSSDKIFKLTGDSAIIDKYGNVTNFKMKEPVDNKPIFETIKKADTKTKGIIGLFGLFLILIIVSIGMYFYKYRNTEEEKKDKKIKKSYRNIFKK